MMMKFCSTFGDILLLAVFFTSSHGQNEEPAILNHTVPDNDYPSDYDDYPSLDYYGDDREGRSLGNDADDYSTNAFHVKDDAFFLKQLRSTIPGIPGTDYSLYQSVPDTSFECRNQQQPGFYGDVEAQCQVFHICQEGNRQDSFLCPIGTVFNQRTFICDWWFNFKCEDTPIYFHLNALFFYEMTSSTTPKSQQVIHKIRRSRHMSSNLEGMMALRRSKIHNMDEDGISKRKRIRNLFMPGTTRSKKVWKFSGQLPFNDKKHNSSRSQKAIEQDDSSATTNTVQDNKNSYNQPILDYAISSLASTASDSTEPNAISALASTASDSTEPSKPSKEGALEESTTDSSDGDNIDYNITAVDISTVDGFATSTHYTLDNNSYLFSTSRQALVTKQQSGSDTISSTKMPLPPDFVYQNSNLSVVEDTKWNLKQNNYSNSRSIDSTDTSHRERYTPAALEFPSNSVTKTLEDGGSTTTFSSPTTVSSVEATPLSEFDIRILPLASPLPLNFVAKTIEDKDSVTLNMKERPSKSNGTWIIGKQNHISVSVTIGSSTSRSHLQWKRQSDAKRIRKFHLNDLKRGNDNPNFRERHSGIKRPRSRIMWIPSRDGTFERRNHWQKLTDYLKERVPVDISLKEDVPVDINLKKDVPAEVNLKKDVSLDVNLNKDAPVEINLKELPFDVNLKEDVIVDGSLKKDGPIDVSLKKDVSFDVNLKKVVPIDARLKEDVPVDVILKKAIPVAAPLKEDIPIDVQKPSLAKATITDPNILLEMKKMAIQEEYEKAQPHNPTEVKEFGNEQSPKRILHNKLLQEAVANNLDEITPTHFLSDIEQMTMDTSENALQSTANQEYFLPNTMEETKVHPTVTGSSNSVQNDNGCNMVCIKLLRNLLKLSNATQNENNSVAHAESNAENSADKTPQAFSRRGFLGLSSSEHFTVKYDAPPNCNKDQDEDKFLVRGWSVIIDSGHITKEKTVKKRNCKSILNDSEIILMQAKNNRGSNSDYDTADITSRWPQKLPASKHKDLEFGSMDQQYWLGLVKNWLKAIPSSDKSNNDKKLRRDSTEADSSYPSYFNDHSAQNANRHQLQNSNWNRNHPSGAASWSSKYQNSRVADSSDTIKYSGDLDNSETRTDHEARNITTKFSQIADDSTDATKQTFLSYSVTEHEPLEEYIRDSWIQKQNTRHFDSAPTKDTVPKDNEVLFDQQSGFDRFAEFQNVNVGMQNEDESRKNFENVQSNIRAPKNMINWTSQSIHDTKEWLPQTKSQKLNWSTETDNYNEDWSSKSENQKDLLFQQEDQLKPETEKKSWSFRLQNEKMDWFLQPKDKKQDWTSHTEGSVQDWFAQSEDRRRDWSAEPELNYRAWGSQFSNEKSNWASQKEDNKKVWPENHKRDETSKDSRSDRSSQNKGKQDRPSQRLDKNKDWYLQSQIKKQDSWPKTEEQNWFSQTKDETSDWPSQSTSNTLDWSEGNQNPDWSAGPEDKKRDWSSSQDNQKRGWSVELSDSKRDGYRQTDNRKGDWSSQPNQKPDLSSQTKGQSTEWSSEGKDQKQIRPSQAKGQKEHWPSQSDGRKRDWSSRPRDQTRDWSAPSKDEKQNWSLEPENRKKGQGRDWPAKTDDQKGDWSTPAKGQKRDWSTQARDQTKDWSSQPDNQKRDWSSQPDNQKRDWSSQSDNQKRDLASKPDNQNRDWSSQPDNQKRDWSSQPDNQKQDWSSQPDQKRDWFTQTQDQKRDWASKPDQKRDSSVKAKDEKRDWSSPPDRQKTDWSQPDQKRHWSSQPDQKRDWSTQVRDQKRDWSSQPDQKRDWSSQPDQKRDWSSQPDQKRDWSSQPDQKRDWSSQPDQKRDWSSQPGQKRDWFTQTQDQKRDWSSKPDPKRDWSVKAKDEKRDWSSPPDRQKTDWSQPDQKRHWSSQPDQKRDWSTQVRDQKRDWSSQPDQKRDWSSQPDQKRDWSSQPDQKRDWSSQPGQKRDWSSQLDQKREWSSQPDPTRGWSNQGKDQKLDWASQADNQKRDWSSQPDNQERDWSSQPDNKKQDWSSQQSNQKRDRSSQPDQKRDWSYQARDQNQDWSSQPHQKLDWSTQARDQKPSWSSQSDPKRDWLSQAKGNTEARPSNSDNRRSDDSLSFRFPSDTTDKEQSDWSWRSEKRSEPKEPQWPIKSPDYPSGPPANVLKGQDSTRKDWHSGKGGALKGGSSWPATIAEESSWQSDSPQGDTAGPATIVDKRHTKPFEKGIQQNGSKGKSPGLWKGDDGSSKRSPESTQDKRSSTSTKMRNQHEARSPRRDSDTRFAAGKENFPKGISQMKINWPSDSNKHQMQWPSDTPASRGDKKTDNAWSEQARTDATIVHGYPRDSDSSRFGSKGQSPWASDSIPQPGSGHKGKKMMDSGSWNQEAIPLPEQRRKSTWNFRSDATDLPNGSKGSPDPHLPKPVLKDNYPSDKTHVKGNAGQKEDKIIWSVQISSNGKPTNGWVPITLRPDLRPRNGGDPKSGGKDEDSSVNNNDWGNKAIDSWNAAKDSKASMDPSVKLDIVTSATPEVIEASDQHMFYIPTVNRRYKRDPQEHLDQKKYAQENNTTSYKVVTNPNKLGKNYHKDRFYLARADISVEGDFLKEIGRSEVLQEQRNGFGELLSKPNENDSRPFYSSHNPDGSDVRNKTHLKEFQQEISSQVQWSVPFDFSKVPASGWVPIVNAKTVTKGKSLKLTTAVKEFINSSSGKNRASHANAKRENITEVLEKPQKAMEGSNGAEILYPEEEIENFSKNASNELNQIQPTGENKPSDLKNETEFETGNMVKETRMKIGNETLRILPFSNIMKQLAEHDIKSSESWNIPLTSAPKVYSLKLVNDHTTSLKSNASNVWTFPSGAQSAWVLVKNNNNSNNSKRVPHSDQNSIINKLKLASGSQQNSSQHYKIIIGNRTNVVLPSELSGGKVFRGKEDYSVGGSLFFNSSVSQKDSGWVPLLRGVGRVVPRNITQSQRTNRGQGLNKNH